MDGGEEKLRLIISFFIFDSFFNGWRCSLSFTNEKLNFTINYM
jgi:hypothetical protein